MIKKNTAIFNRIHSNSQLFCSTCLSSGQFGLCKIRRIPIPGVDYRNLRPFQKENYSVYSQHGFTTTTKATTISDKPLTSCKHPLNEQLLYKEKAALKIRGKGYWLVGVAVNYLSTAGKGKSTYSSSAARCS